MNATDDQPSRLAAAQHPAMRSGLRKAAQRLAFANDSVALLAALLLANSLRLHFPGWAADILFGMVTALLGLSLFRDGGIFGAKLQGRPGQPMDASKLLLTLACFATLLMLHGTGLVFDFSGQGLRNFAGLACIALVFLFCYQNGRTLAQSRGAILLFLLGALAFLPLYWTPAEAHPVFLSVYLGYALLAMGILLAARCRSRKAQHLWAGAAFLAAAMVSAALGSRALALAMLLALPFYWCAHRLLRSRGGALALAGGVLALAGLASTLLGFSRLQEVLLSMDDLARSYTGEALDNGRRMLFQASMSGILDAPWFGNGPAADVTTLASNSNAPLKPQEPYCLLWANPGLLQDCKALLQARDVLAGANKDRLWQWDFDQPISTWTGVALGGSPLRILGVDLTERELAGQIPPVLGELQQLSVLRLERNYLTGAIPAELGKLRSLTTLSLSYNLLTGAVPKALGSLANLKELGLDHNQLSGEVPNALTALDKLRDLRLHGNDFADLPPLKLIDRQSDFHKGLLCLPSMREHPELLQDCTTLLEARDTLAGSGVWLNWRHNVPLNQWTGVELGGWPRRVSALNLPQAGLRGQIPAQFATLDGLTELNLQGNRLNGEVPVELALLPRLESLRLAHNEFSAPMPAELRTIMNHDLDEDLHCAPGPRIGPGLLKDCTTLLAIASDLAGNGRLNWRQSTPIGLWSGVGVREDPARVVRLHLPDAGLSGRIPQEIGRLDQLARLHLQNNALTGPVPAELGRLENLESLLLTNNELDGVPPPQLGALPNLRRLELQGNEFAEGVPATLREVVDRNTHKNWFCPLSTQDNSGLAADCNLLLAVRDTLAGDGKLNWRRDKPLGLWQGVFTWGSPARVWMLRLNGIGFSGRIPPELGKLAKLRALRLRRNALKGPIPAQLGNLKELEVLDLRYNELAGAIPTELQSLKAEVLTEHNNLVRKTPSAPARPQRENSPTAGLAPAAPKTADADDAGLGMLCQELSADNPGLQADCDLLLAVRDQLAGSIRLNWAPATPIGFWQGVTLGGTPMRVIALDLSRRGIDGLIPSELAGLDRLVSLRLQRNALAGPIPATLGQLAHLKELLLSGNALTGSIPKQLGRLSRLTALHLRRNRLHGAIPAELGKLTSLQSLALDGNDLTGPIPAELGELLDLEELMLGNNRLSEAMPAAVWALPKLAVLWPQASFANPALAGQPLVETAGTARAAPEGGETPRDAELVCGPGLGAGLRRDCTRLLELRDELAGDADLNWRPSVPINAWRGVRIGGRPARVEAIELPQANLNGSFPPDVRLLEDLTSLRLEGNQLTGRLVETLGQLTRLRTLALDGNKLTGAIPPKLLDLQLEHLGLSDNRLTGSLISISNKLPSVQRLNLGGNDFTGCLPPKLRGAADRRIELDLRCDPSPWGKPRLLEDAAILMGIRKVLAGDAEINWRYDRPLGSWQGVSIGGKPMRVVALDLSEMGLNGRIPPQLGALEGLVDLRLTGNRLTGAIPPELGRLTELHRLRLDGNALIGSLPETLQNLHRLEELRLEGNQFVSCREENAYAIHRFLSIKQFPFCQQWTDEIGDLGRQIRLVNDFVNPAETRRLAESSHNLFLHIGLQSGLTGLGGAALLCLSLIFNLRRRTEESVTPVHCFTAAAAFTAILYSVFEIFLLQHFLSAAVFAWAAFGIGTGLVHFNPSERRLKK